MITNKKILFTTLQKNSETIKSFGVERIGVFGSFVRNEADENSDVDFLIEFRQGQKKYSNLFSLHTFLETLTQRKVEVLTRESLSPYIGPYILNEVEYVQIGNWISETYPWWDTFILEHTQQISEKDFLNDEVYKRASARSIKIIGEAVKNISQEFKDHHSSIDWKKMSGMRDRLIHGYLEVDYDLLWGCDSQ